MKDPNLIIRIPEPCHEDWNKMQPDYKGKFCGSCNKSVFDFTNKTDLEIRDILVEYKDQKVCGHFKKSQIDRPLNISINFNDLPRNISSTRAFAIALFLVFGTLLFSCTNDKNEKVNSIEVVNTNDLQRNTLGGAVSYLYLKGDTISEQDSIPTISCGESYIDGGISIGEVVPREEFYVTGEGQPIIEDSIPEIKEYVKGKMVCKPDSTIMLNNDSTIAEHAQKISNQTADEIQTNLSVYPNPSSGEFTIKYDLLKRADIRIDVLNISGSIVSTVVNVSNQHEGKYQVSVNLKELPNGVYVVNLLNNGKRSSAKLIIEK